MLFNDTIRDDGFIYQDVGFFIIIFFIIIFIFIIIFYNLMMLSTSLLQDFKN